jgi:hypothetical protein
MRLLSAACALIFTACGDHCPRNFFQNVTDYRVAPTVSMITGWRIDSDIGFFTALTELDARMDKMDDCVLKVAAGIKSLNPIWGCIRPLPTQPFDRSCLIVKVVPPVYSACSTWEHLPAEADPRFCRDKGLEPTLECPCLWRSAIQDDYVLVTPPAMYAWDIVRMYTGCNNLWGSPFAVCAMF